MPVVPTIEIVSIQAPTLPPLPRFTTLAIIAERQAAIESHRGLFNDTLGGMSGVILHLGDPDLDPEDGGWFAGKLIEWRDESMTIPLVDPADPHDQWGAGQTERFRFLPTARIEVEQVLNLALQASPIGKAVFLTDYQFGPELPTLVSARAPAALWAEHDKVGLRWNHLYHIEP